MPLQKFHPVNLSEYFNNDGISYDDLKCDGAEELPDSNSLINIDGIPFYFPDKKPGAKNNLTLREQVFIFPAYHYKSLFLIGASKTQQLVALSDF